MKRIQFFEFEDLNWFPKRIRKYVTEYLRFASNTLKLYHPALPVLKKYIEQADGQVLDLASGGGGPWSSLIPDLIETTPELRIQLSDYYPNPAAAQLLMADFPEHITYNPNRVDARNVPPSARGLRTQFLSLHHFAPHDVIQIFKNAVDSQQPVLIMEAQERNVANLIKIALSPIPALFIMPLIRPFSIWRLVFTYLIPIIPFIIGFDGVVSVLRTYTIKELNTLSKLADQNSKFTWESGRIREKGKVVLWFGGYPSARS